ncbi:hypothetical protein NQ318_017549 [Aromia moschata]|uniref:3'-5' exonuclease n=1 Tax=Aromia moschata TaxID=1265417 RepID=A0AAV8Z0J5_9CUCU|nr:hypothetical protein NQ318_017549 [Aromia moschata]
MEVSATGMKLRSRVSAAEKEEQAKKLKLEKEAWENRPFIQYKGILKYHTELIDCAIQCDNLLERAKKTDDLMVVGFDMEWSFSFETGPGKTAVIQISPDLNTCYILHVSKLRNLPKGLSEFLAHPKVRLTGNNIKKYFDVRKLARDFTGFDVDRLIENCIDLGVMANSILPVKQRWSLEKLVDYTLNMKINKDKKASLMIYLTLKEREQQEMEKEQNQNVNNVIS